MASKSNVALDLRLPSQPQDITAVSLYQMTLLGDMCEQLAYGCYLAAERPGVEWRVHYTTTSLEWIPLVLPVLWIRSYNHIVA